MESTCYMYSFSAMDRVKAFMTIPGMGVGVGVGGERLRVVVGVGGEGLWVGVGVGDEH